MIMTLFELAQRLVGEIQERPGSADHPFIVWCHESTTMGAAADEVPWCSSFVNRLAWLLRLPRSKSAAARSWLTVGTPVIDLHDARAAYDIVVLQRGTSETQGHVGVFMGIMPMASSVPLIQVIGGNQSNGVTVEHYPVTRLLGIRRLRD